MSDRSGVVKVSEEDYLENDQQIPGQNFYCVSFVSPEKTLKQKDLYYHKEFIKNFYNTKQDEIAKLKEAYEGMKLFYNLAEKSLSDNDNFTEMLKDLKVHSTRALMAYDGVKNMYKTSYEDVERFYKDFKFANEERIEKEFLEKNNFHTTIRGLKVRGVYDTLKEAQMRAGVLRRRDSNFSVYVAQIGYWVPFDPNDENIKDQEYQENDLNTLVKSYKENADKRDEHFVQDKEDRKRQALEENARKKKQLKELKKRQAEADKEKKVEVSLELSAPEDSIAKIDELRKIVNDKNMLSDNLKKDDPWMTRKNNEEAATITDLPDLPDNIELVNNTANNTANNSTTENTTENTEAKVEENTEEKVNDTLETLNKVANSIF